MNWEDIKTKKWKLSIILLVILVVFLLLSFLVPKYLYVQSCWLPPCYGPPHPIEIKPTKLWQNTYDINESLNTLEFPYSKAILDCPASVYIKFPESPQIIESVNLEGKELLLEPTTITPLILEDYNLTKPEGVLEVKVRAKSKSNIFIQMSQYKEPC